MHRLPRWRILLTGLMAVAVAAAGVINWDLYFRKYITAAETRTPYVSYHSTMAGVLSRTEPGRPVIVISPRTFGAAQRKTDYVWLIPEDLESYGARNRNELFEILGEMIPGTEVVLLIQGPGNLDEWEAELRDLFHCGPFKRIENPDNPRVEIRRSVVTIPAELPGIEDQAEGVEEGPDSPNLSPDEEMVPPPSTGEDRGAGNSPGPPIVE